ncbi:hypothetical protein DFH29DRAFT_882668 [Suillus ampliporus]|nr:hypothetical protein DFH29DRAFT_882668 [Suillus ampliporus]
MINTIDLDIQLVAYCDSMSIEDSRADSEVSLVIDLARAKCNLILAQKALAECKVKESEVMTSLMKLEANNVEHRLDDIDLGLGHMHAILRKHGLSYCPPPLPQRYHDDDPHGTAIKTAQGHLLTIQLD